MRSLRNIADLVLVPGLAFTLIAALTISSALYVRSQGANEAQREFQRGAIDRVTSVERQLKLSIAVVDLVGTFFDTDEEVTEREFESFVDPILRRNPAISALSFAPRVTLENRDDFETEAATRHPGFRISEQLEPGKMVPAEDRGMFTPVRYLVPIAGNEAALGFDLASDAGRKAALDAAHRRNEIRATRPIVLVQETSSARSFLLIRPVYARSLPIDSVAAREAAVTGYVTAVMRSDGLIGSALAQLVPAGIHFTVSDVTQREDPAILAHHSSRARPFGEAGLESFEKPGLESTQTFSAAGRDYRVELAAASGFFGNSAVAASWTILVAGLAFGIALAAYLLLLHRTDRQLRESAQALRQLSDQLLQVQEEERARLSRELHDEVGQATTALQLNLQVLRGYGLDTKADNLFDDCTNIISRIVQQVRSITLDLRPPMLDDLGLEPTLSWFLRRQTERAGLALSYSFDPAIGRLPRATATAAFRLVQEGTTNIIRHARASRVEVDLWQEDSEIIIRLRDDGRGISFEDPPDWNSPGLSGLRERAKLAGGSITLERRADGGTTLMARLPRPDTPDSTMQDAEASGDQGE